MTQVFNVYCDESCHLEHDRQGVMVLGAIWSPLEKSREIARSIRDLKERHGLAQGFEIKWTKVSPGKIDFYADLIDYFFAEEDLHFRALIVGDKTSLAHEVYGQTHDEWYFKMYFTMLKARPKPEHNFRLIGPKSPEEKDALLLDSVAALGEACA